MFSRAELERLATRKALVRARIAVRRLQTAEHARRVAQPVAVLDQIVADWQAAPPGARGKLPTLLKYAPVALQALKLARNFRAKPPAAEGVGQTPAPTPAPKPRAAA